jgi:hypothetical protein
LLRNFHPPEETWIPDGVIPTTYGGARGRILPGAAPNAAPGKVRPLIIRPLLS